MSTETKKTSSKNSAGMSSSENVRTQENRECVVLETVSSLEQEDDIQILDEIEINIKDKHLKSGVGTGSTSSDAVIGVSCSQQKDIVTLDNSTESESTTAENQNVSVILEPQAQPERPRSFTSDECRNTPLGTNNHSTRRLPPSPETEELLDDRPLITVTFRDSEIARKYSSSIENSLHNLLHNNEEVDSCTKNNINGSSRPLELKIWKGFTLDVCGNEKLLELNSPRISALTDPWSRDRNQSPREARLGDRWSRERTDRRNNPQRDRGHNRGQDSRHITSEVPMYRKTFNTVLQNVAAAEKDRTAAVPNKSHGCFNCKGSHNIADCPLPIDHRAVQQSRREFRISQAMKGNCSRYHVESSRRYSNIKPGVLSANLRDALNLRPNQIPFFFYRMRKLGYPPGWLQEARVPASGLKVFNSTDWKSVAIEDKNEGRSTFDADKIIDYPGYNVEPPPNMMDETRFFGVPPINPHAKEELINLLRAKVSQGYKRKKQRAPGSSKVETVLDLDDMDCIILDETSASDGEITEVDPHGSEQSVPKKKKRSSPTLIDLEDEKRELLSELNQHAVTALTAKPISDVQIESDVQGNPLSSRSKTVTLGTPIVDSISPYLAIPDSSNFKVNMDDWLNFENPVNYTGTYQKISSLLKKSTSLEFDNS